MIAPYYHNYRKKKLNSDTVDLEATWPTLFEFGILIKTKIINDKLIDDKIRTLKFGTSQEAIIDKPKIDT